MTRHTATRGPGAALLLSLYPPEWDAEDRADIVACLDTARVILVTRTWVPHPPTRPAECCLATAICAAGHQLNDTYTTFLAGDALRLALGQDDLGAWNDKQTDRQAVLDLLRQTADHYRS